MCGGAIISDFIPPPRSRRVTSEFIWPDLKKKGKASKKKRSDFLDLEDEFEADFQGLRMIHLSTAKKKMNSTSMMMMSSPMSSPLFSPQVPSQQLPLPPLVLIQIF
ncbi:Uncharacterized protein Rs2_20388 [Raphanus sativus]|nr:Uncharacterized protein Rs2_20388 [Raphanus sativus]